MIKQAKASIVYIVFEVIILNQMKNLQKLGKALNKAEQKMING